MELACKDVSGMVCDFVAYGETAEKTKDALKQHGREAHQDMMAEATEENMKMMEDKMDSLLAEQ